MYIAICDDDKQYLGKVDKYMQDIQKTFGDIIKGTEINLMF